ncbi:MAG TPA: hypothetical protein VFS20_00925 [Longimicrobium sp.]|nr:hypothetical protein [Longimicrobium sp.]
MSTRFTGRIVGALADDASEPLEGARVRVYRIQNGTTAGKEDRLVAEAATDQEGAFELSLAPGEPLEVDVVLGDGAQVTLGTVETAAAARGPVEIRIPPERWAEILGTRLRRRIYGRITVCGTDQGVGGVKVSAFDSDCIQDDALGSDFTDAAGNYVIYYSEAQYKQTPLSPVINIDTPLSGADGPDVYMKIQTGGGDLLLDEASNVGRGPSRRNAPYIFKLDLCVKGEVKKPPQVATLPMFDRVGMYSILPADADFTAQGVTTAGQFAFTGTIPLRGVLPDGGEGEALEYRFTVRKYANPDGTGALGAAFPLDGDHIGATEIGTLVYLDYDHVNNAWLPQKSTPFYAGHPGNPTIVVHRPAALGGNVVVSVNTPIKAGGWIEVPRLDDLSFGGKGKFQSGTYLAQLDTRKLSHQEENLGALAAGQPVPVGQRAEPDVFQVTFHARKVSDASAASSSTLERISMINTTYTYVLHPNWAGGTVSKRGVVSVNVAEVVDGPNAGCGKVNNQVHVTYTVYHPFIRSAGVSFEGPVVVPGATHAVANGHLTSPDVPAPGLDGELFDFNGKPNCAYNVWLGATVELTSGWGQIIDGGINDHIAFCKG